MKRLNRGGPLYTSELVAGVLNAPDGSPVFAVTVYASAPADGRPLIPYTSTDPANGTPKTYVSIYAAGTLNTPDGRPVYALVAAPGSYGPELFVNGDGSSTAGYTAGGDAILSSVGGRLRVTVDADGVNTSGAWAQEAVVLSVGQQYRLTCTMWASQSGMARIQDTGGNIGIQEVVGFGPTTIDLVFTAAANFIPQFGAASAAAWASANQFAEFDNISLKRVL